ncbi:hypothetical protein [Lactobacillus crispatus]|uniref:hypothetical protein n=1 Tax=Lactobacillus crispatus TaxID=47770 RepID=UPI0023A96D95|nr:hypothetical protein [Lactobacillus crispatus]WEB33802.1 hypothetical protein PUW44_06125 [Lactobacillus crispatus]
MAGVIIFLVAFIILIFVCFFVSAGMIAFDMYKSIKHQEKLEEEKKHYWVSVYDEKAGNIHGSKRHGSSKRR